MLDLRTVLPRQDQRLVEMIVGQFAGENQRRNRHRDGRSD